MINYFIKNSKFGSICISDNLTELCKFISKLKHVFYIVDENIYYKYNDIFNLKLNNSIIIKSGEQSKNIYIYNLIINKLVICKYYKKTNIVSIGGGVIGDLSGFVASTFYRGVKLIHIPTTLLSQVDSSIGGKNAVNSSYGKNLIGSYYHPNYIFICNDFLKSLSNYYYLMGLSEVLKSSVIFDRNFLKYLYLNYDNIINRKKYIIKYIVKKAVFLKLSVVKIDEKEDLLLRYKLNLGHTYAHSIEKYLNYTINHGEAVYYGMIFASILSINNLNYLDINYIRKLIFRLNPYICNNILRINISKISKNISFDKKKLDFSKTSFIIIKRIGSVNIKTLNLNQKKIKLSIRTSLSKLVNKV
ncbi:3-dehydroquinate synthase [Candidatus Vidania fulgoroideae]|uniref:3-dehydroquinate synthase n=1 Tax=Candidatus Vidania fulgoroideorum TaxID=881286 RepID=A0A974X9B0_9PROT|nr:3-dehydroquinate synthase [Candidatus Vidania fulgoroideae]